MGKFGSY
jgi:hypothetical protein